MKAEWRPDGLGEEKEAYRGENVMVVGGSLGKYESCGRSAAEGVVLSDVLVEDVEGL